MSPVSYTHLIDVTIVDENLVRVAGTGIYIEKIGKKVNGYSAFKKSIIEQSNILITDPSCNEICKECYSRSDLSLIHIYRKTRKPV